MTLHGCVTAEITSNTAHACHVLTWSWKPWLLLHQDFIGAASWLCYMRLCFGWYGYVMVMLCLLLWLLHQSGENKCICSSYSSSHFLPASQLASCPPWVQWTVCTVRYSKTVGTVSKISKRVAMKPTPVFLPGEFPWTEEPGGYSPWGRQVLDTTEQRSKAKHGR